MYNNFKNYKFHVEYEDENGNKYDRYHSFLLHPDSNIAFATAVCIIINDLPIGSTINTVSLIGIN